MKIELLIENKGTLYEPVVKSGATWETERKGSPGKLRFTVVRDNTVVFAEGNAVRLRVDNNPVFYGFVFTKKRDKDHNIEVTAYDQIRYLKNKDTRNFFNVTATDVIKMIAADFRLQTGEIEQTAHTIPFMAEDNTTLMDMIYNALDHELMNKGKMFVFYDDFGKLTLKSIENMRVGALIDRDTGQNFDYTSSIDDATYNKIKLTYESDGKREIYIAQDGERMNEWGVLQYLETLQEGENGAAKADALLSLYNVKTRNLKIAKAFGDIRVRAGTMLVVKLDLGDVSLSNFMLVEKAVHSFDGNGHYMDLTLRGGEFVG